MSQSPQSAPPARPIHLVWVFLLGAAAWSLTIGSHELIGHGAVCAIDPNCRWIYADGMYFDGEHQAGAWRVAELAGGSGFNILFALVCAAVLGFVPPSLWSMRVLLWALVTAGLLQSGSYIAFGPIIHDGMDWARLRDDHGWPYAFLIALGGGTIVLGLVLSKLLLDHSAILRGGRAALVLPAWAGFVVTGIGVAFIIPSDDRWLMVMGGFGSSGIFMAPILLLLLPLGTPKHARTDLAAADYAVLAFAVAVTASYTFWLGPGIRFA